MVVPRRRLSSTTPSAPGGRLSRTTRSSCEAEQIDVLVDVTGSVEFGAQVVLEAFKHGKSVVLMNAELDATIGPILQTYAKHDVSLSSTEGDEPGLQTESLPLGAWARARAARNRERQGPTRSVSQSDDATGVCGEVGPEPRDGDVVR